MKEAGLYYSDGSYKSREVLMSMITPPELEVERPVIDEPLSFEQHMNHVETLQDIAKETGLWKEEVEIGVETSGFPFFAFRRLSDMHIGAKGTDMDAVKMHLEQIKKYPVYTAMIGDIGDFFGPSVHPEGMMGDVIDPDDQLLMIRRFYEEYKDKILCNVQDPSHTDWIRQMSGIEPQRYLVENLGISSLISGGLIKIKVDSQEYKGLLFHQIGQYNSSLNLTNAHKRMLDMHEDVDFVIAGHRHIGAMEKLVKRTKKAVCIQLGTFKTADDFGRRKGLVPRPQPFYPTLFFDGRKHNIEIIEDPTSAVEWMQTYAQLEQLKGKDGQG